MKRYRLPVLTSTVTVPACQYTVPKQYRYSTETGLRAHWTCTGTVPLRYSSGIKMVPFLYWWCRFTVVVVQKLYNFWTDENMKMRGRFDKHSYKIPVSNPPFGRLFLLASALVSLPRVIYYYYCMSRWPASFCHPGFLNKHLS